MFQGDGSDVRSRVTNFPDYTQKQNENSLGQLIEETRIVVLSNHVKYFKFDCVFIYFFAMPLCRYFTVDGL